MAVAVKICSLSPSQVLVENGVVVRGSPFHMEVPMAARMRHPNVVRLHASDLDRSTPGHETEAALLEGSGDPAKGWRARIVMELCENGSLRNALRQGLLDGQEGEPVPPELGTVLALAYDVACGVVYIHTLQVLSQSLVSHL